MTFRFASFVLLPAYILLLSCGGHDAATTTEPPIATLEFRAQPSSGSVLFPISPAVEVALHDASGSLAASANASVTVRLLDNSSGAHLLGTTTVSAKGGVASFPDLRVDEPGGAYVLTASVEGSSAIARSAPFDVPAPRLRADQQQPISQANANTVFIGGTSEQKLAQVVTAGVTGWLAEIKLPVACANGSLIAELQGVADDKPDGTVLTSETIDGAIVSGQVGSMRDIVFSVPIQVNAGQQLALVLRATGDCGMLQGPEGNPYAGGDGYFDARPSTPGVWNPLGSPADLPFETWVIR